MPMGARSSWNGRIPSILAQVHAKMPDPIDEVDLEDDEEDVDMGDGEIDDFHFEGMFSMVFLFMRTDR
jgi:hypothetical protein